MAGVCARKHVEGTKRVVKKAKPTKRKTKKKYRSREVSPSRRPKYGCGRLHWNMRNHGKIDVRRYKRKPKAKAAEKTAVKERLIESALTEYSQVTTCYMEPRQECSEGNETNVTSINAATVTEDKGTICRDDQPHLSASHASETPQASATGCKAAPVETADSNVQVDTETEDKQVSAHLIYDDDDEEGDDSVKQLHADLEDSLMDVATVPEEESSPACAIDDRARTLPPVFPWSTEQNLNSTNNNNHALFPSVYSMIDNYMKVGRGGRLPHRKCAMYATIKIKQMYNMTRRKSKRMYGA